MSGTSSSYWTVYKFFASQSQRNIYNNNFFFPAKQKTAQFLPFIFCFIRELNPLPPPSGPSLCPSLRPLPLPLPLPIHDCAVGAFDYLGSECDHLPEAGNIIRPSLRPPIRPYLGNVAKLIRRRRISLKRDNHPKNPSA
jgi:hypothetical protein